MVSTYHLDFSLQPTDLSVQCLDLRFSMAYLTDGSVALTYHYSLSLLVSSLFAVHAAWPPLLQYTSCN
jgi:hypothetical protein